MRLYAEISKSEQQADGTIKVWGYASSESVDSDGEVITADAMKAALPDYMTFGAVREMHDSRKAAGTAIEASVGDDGRTFFGAHVVDSEAVKKVQAGVYKGFSIGGKVLERDNLNKSIIKGIKLIEVSLVDRPANPEAVITIMKADDADSAPEGGAPTADDATPPATGDESAEKAARTPEDDVTDLADLISKGEITPGEVLALIAASKAAPAAATETVAKGMRNIGELAYLLKQVLWIVKDQADEAAREGDGSDVPAKLADWLAAGTEILVAMTTEEVGEMMAELAGDGGPELPGAVFLAAKAIALSDSDEAVKVGRALSAATMKHVNAIHEATAALGACTATKAETTKAAESEELAKSLALEVTAEKHRADELEKSLGTVTGELELAKAEVAKLKAAPVAAKAILKALVVGKEADATDPDANKTAEAPAIQSTDPLELIKAAQLNPRFIPMR